MEILPYIYMISHNGDGYSITFVPSDDISPKPKLFVKFPLCDEGELIHQMLQKIAEMAQQRWQTTLEDSQIHDH